MPTIFFSLLLTFNLATYWHTACACMHEACPTACIFSFQENPRRSEHYLHQTIIEPRSQSPRCYKVTHCVRLRKSHRVRLVSANTRPHQLCWDDWENVCIVTHNSALHVGMARKKMAASMSHYTPITYRGSCIYLLVFLIHSLTIYYNNYPASYSTHV